MPLRRPFTAAFLLSLAMSATAVDLAPLWDFNDPAASEQRFPAALAGSLLAASASTVDDDTPFQQVRFIVASSGMR